MLYAGDAVTPESVFRATELVFVIPAMVIFAHPSQSPVYPARALFPRVPAQVMPLPTTNLTIEICSPPDVKSFVDPVGPPRDDSSLTVRLYSWGSFGFVDRNQDETGHLDLGSRIVEFSISWVQAG